MTTTDGQLSLRPPTWARVWVVAFPAVMVAVLASDVVPLRGEPGWAVRALVGLFAVALGWRLFRLAAVGTPDGRLLVRNHWRDRELHRDDVAEVVVDVAGHAPNRSVQLVLRNGDRVRLDVTEAPAFGPLRRRMERHATAVREWVGDRA